MFCGGTILSTTASINTSLLRLFSFELLVDALYIFSKAINDCVFSVFTLDTKSKISFTNLGPTDVVIKSACAIFSQRGALSSKSKPLIFSTNKSVDEFKLIELTLYSFSKFICSISCLFTSTNITS